MESTVKRYEECDGCDGTGLMEGWNHRDGNSCPKCKGEGKRELAAKPYNVEWEQDGCSFCHHGRTYTVVGPDDVALGQSWEREEDAQDVADYMNQAYDVAHDQLRRENERLKAELKVRSGQVSFEYETPERFRKRGVSTAYGSGWEAGFRGWKFEQCYERDHLRLAFVSGYEDGSNEAQSRIDAALAVSEPAPIPSKRSDVRKMRKDVSRMPVPTCASGERANPEGDDRCKLISTHPQQES